MLCNVDTRRANFVQPDSLSQLKRNKESQIFYTSDFLNSVGLSGVGLHHSQKSRAHTARTKQ